MDLSAPSSLNQRLQIVTDHICFWEAKAACTFSEKSELGNRSESSPSKRPGRHIYIILFLLALEPVSSCSAGEGNLFSPLYSYSSLNPRAPDLQRG